MLFLVAFTVLVGCGGTSVIEPTPSSNPAVATNESMSTTTILNSMTDTSVESSGGSVTSEAPKQTDETEPAATSSTSTPPVSSPSTTTVTPAPTTTTEVVTLEPGEAPQTGFVSVEPEAA